MRPLFTRLEDCGEVVERLLDRVCGDRPGNTRLIERNRRDACDHRLDRGVRAVSDTDRGALELNRKRRLADAVPPRIDRVLAHDKRHAGIGGEQLRARDDVVEIGAAGSAIVRVLQAHEHDLFVRIDLAPRLKLDAERVPPRAVDGRQTIGVAADAVPTERAKAQTVGLVPAGVAVDETRLEKEHRPVVPRRAIFVAPHREVIGRLPAIVCNPDIAARADALRERLEVPLLMCFERLVVAEHIHGGHYSAVVSEAEKYRLCYESPRYGLQGARLKRVTQDIESIAPGSTYVDIGCGRGEMIALARDRGVVARGVELVPSLCGGSIEHGTLEQLLYPDRWFDYVSCYDVVEHLPPGQVDRALDELFRITGCVLFITTNDKPSFYQGMELHLTRRPREWWDQHLVRRALPRGGQIERSTYGRDEWHWRIAFAAGTA